MLRHFDIVFVKAKVQDLYTAKGESEALTQMSQEQRPSKPKASLDDR